MIVERIQFLANLYWKHVKQAWSRQCKDRSHLEVPGPRRWIAFLLMFALITSGLQHFAVIGHDVAPEYAHELVSLGEDAGDASCCPDHLGQPHAANCSMSSGCFLWVALSSPAATLRSEADSAQWTVEAVYSDHIASALLRPPRIS